MNADLFVLLFRLFIGGFFILAAYRKSLEPGIAGGAWPELRQQLGLAPYWQWLIPLAQLLGGLGLVFGAFTRVAALGLFAIIAGAVWLDVFKPFCAANAGNTRAGWCYAIMENYHAIYLLILGGLVLSGGGYWSLDHALAAYL